MTEEAPQQQPTLRHWPRLALVGTVWAALVAAWLIHLDRSGVGAIDAAQQLVDAARGNWWAIAAYVAASVLRPLVLFPATIVTIAAGMLFGAAAGIVIAAGAANLSAFVGYEVGRVVRPSRTPTRPDSRLAGWGDRLRSNSFEAVLLMRLLFLPYDLVNYACGLLHVRRTPFITATAIGSLPGTVAFVLVGASITRLDEGTQGIDGTTLAVSIALILLSIVGSRVLRRRTALTLRTTSLPPDSVRE